MRHLFFLFPLFNKMVILRRFRFYLFFLLSSFYQRLVYRRLNRTFNLSSTCYDVMLFVVLLRYFIYMGVFQTSKLNGFNQSKILNYDHQYIKELES